MSNRPVLGFWRRSNCLTNQTSVFLTVLTVVLGMFAWGEDAADASEITLFWDKSDESNQTSIDHTVWQKILEKFVVEHESGINRFDYEGLKEDGESNESLIEYVLQTSEVDPRRYTKSEQLAYWINMYNALVVYLVTSQFPLKSFEEIRLAGPDTEPWDLKIANMQDHRLSLSEIRNDILLPIWGDNRIHFALSDASLGGPNLAKEAFRSDNVEELLESGVSTYLNHSRGVSIKNGELTVSSLFEWYKGDFGGNDEEVITYLRSHTEASLSNQLGEFALFETSYDWRVNSP